VRRALGAAAALAAAVPLCGASGGDSGAALFVVGVWLALVVLLSMPAALLLHTFRPDWIDAEARAFDRRKTACVVAGAGLFVLALVVIGAVWSRKPGLGAVLLVPAFAWFVAGFAGCARRQGERLTESSSGVRPLVVGWLARAGAFAVPVLWPFVATYLVVAALGAPLVAMIERPAPPPST
jgi:hypothetical protein